MDKGMESTDNLGQNFIAKYGNYLACAFLALAIDAVIRSKYSYGTGNIGLSFIFLYLSNNNSWVYRNIPVTYLNHAKLTFKYLGILAVLLSVAIRHYE